jgi:hypothetical protein
MSATSHGTNDNEPHQTQSRTTPPRHQHLPPVTLRPINNTPRTPRQTNSPGTMPDKHTTPTVRAHSLPIPICTTTIPVTPAVSKLIDWAEEVEAAMSPVPVALVAPVVRTPRDFSDLRSGTHNPWASLNYWRRHFSPRDCRLSAFQHLHGIGPNKPVVKTTSLTMSSIHPASPAYPIVTPPLSPTRPVFTLCRCFTPRVQHWLHVRHTQFRSLCMSRFSCCSCSHAPGMVAFEGGPPVVGGIETGRIPWSGVRGPRVWGPFP